MDKIKITNLEVFAYHGVFEEEKERGQKFYVDCTLHLDTRTPGMSDALEDSVDYGEICHFIDGKMREKTYDLIEAVAENLARDILMHEFRIRKVDLEVKKPSAPVGLPFGNVSVAISRGWHEAYLAMGSNMGDKRKYIEDAIAKLDHTQGCSVERVSTLIETEPYGYEDQDSFVNGVMKVNTLLTPEELLAELHKIEREANRERKIHWGPRTLDLDIIFYDDLVVEKDDLCIPHVDMHNRMFVLKPLAEIAPYKRHPIYGKTIQEMLGNI